MESTEIKKVQNKGNQIVDYVKVLMTLFIVIEGVHNIHNVDTRYIPIVSLGIPVLTMILGFTIGTKKDEIIFEYVKGLVKVYGLSTVLFLAYRYYVGYQAKGIFTTGMYNQLFFERDITWTRLLTGTLGGMHLGYIYGLIIGLMLIVYIRRFKSPPWAMTVMSIQMYIISIYLSTDYLPKDGIPRVFMYLTIGYFIRKYMRRISASTQIILLVPMLVYVLFYLRVEFQVVPPNVYSLLIIVMSILIVYVVVTTTLGSNKVSTYMQQFLLSMYITYALVTDIMTNYVQTRGIGVDAIIFGLTCSGVSVVVAVILKLIKNWVQNIGLPKLASMLSKTKKVVEVDGSQGEGVPSKLKPVKPKKRNKSLLKDKLVLTILTKVHEYTTKVLEKGTAGDDQYGENEYIEDEYRGDNFDNGDGEKGREDSQTN